MSCYVKMQISKINSVSDIKLIDQHTDTLINTLNTAERNRIMTILGGDKTYLDHFEEAIQGKKIPKDNVVAIKCFISAKHNPKIFVDKQQLKDWVNNSINWADINFGMNNVKKVYIHQNEEITHLHIFIVPVKNNKLCANYFVGSKSKISDLQTIYYNEMKKYNLEEDIDGSKTITRKEKIEEDKKIISYLDKNLLERQKIMQKVNNAL